MLRLAIVLLGLMTLSSRAENVTVTTLVETSTGASAFVAIGSNELAKSTNGTNASELVATKPIVHAVNAQARKIEMTKLASASGDVTASLRSPTRGAASGAFAISTTMIAIMAALILVVIISVIVGTAVFVMRRRFSIWRLNNSKQNLNGGGSQSGDGGESSTASGAGEEKTEPSSPPAEEATAGHNEDNQLVSVENKNATAVLIESETDKSGGGGGDDDKGQGGKPNESIDGETKNEPAASQSQTDVSSSQTLIVNVLNELSESVANKLDAATKSPSTKSLKSSQPIDSDDVDKPTEPLKQNE